ncbi:MAG: hypothetical protein Q8K99_10060 [Actinomycetota bacterium]|nr:hypothetical protein [Actinomycetota bacterium]
MRSSGDIGVGTDHLGSVDPLIAVQLAKLFQRNGYVRRQNPGRVAGEGWTRYKKGDEVRLVVGSEVDLQRLRGLLSQAGFRPGKAYVQGSGWRQPLYGRKQVAAFLQMVDAVTLASNPGVNPTTPCEVDSGGERA